MFISNRLIYLQLHKTGCTHIAHLLQELVGGRLIGKHDRLPDGFSKGARLIMGSIRNPWDWYVSLWAYGCDKKGGLYERLSSPAKQGILGIGKIPVSAVFGRFGLVRKPEPDWTSFYTSSDNPSQFRKWLRMILDPANRHRLGEGYGKSPISRFGGFLTYRYTYLYAGDVVGLYSKSVASHGKLVAFMKRNSVLDYTIRNECLESDLVEGLRRSGIELSDRQLGMIYSTSRTNVSSRNRRVNYYYDRETVELVRLRERMVIERYGYEPPSLD